jgi:DNA-binding NarL/FixJ family response regulator
LKILHIDDHELFMHGVKAVLAQQVDEFHVTLAHSVSEALGIIEKTPDFDLLLVDLNMPGLDGLSFIDSLDERDIFLPFMVLSASEDIRLIKMALKKGALGFIPKSYGVKDILKIIRNSASGDVYIPENIQKALEYVTDHDTLGVAKICDEYRLGQRQIDVLGLMQKGYSNGEIAQTLNISINTVKTHIKTLYTSFMVKSRIECLVYAERIGLLGPNRY